MSTFVLVRCSICEGKPCAYLRPCPAAERRYVADPLAELAAMGEAPTEFVNAWEETWQLDKQPLESMPRGSKL